MSRARTWSGLLTLCFHRIGAASNTAWERSIWDLKVDELDQALRLIGRYAQLVSPDDVLRMERPPSGRNVLLTFDDGYREWADDVLAVLASHDATAAFFVATGYLDRPRSPWWYEIAWMVRNARPGAVARGIWLSAPTALPGPDVDCSIETFLSIYKQLPGDRVEPFLDWLGEQSGTGRCPASAAADAWLDWEAVRRLRDAGMEIGGHTVSHPVLARLTPAQQREEILECAERIEAETGRPMRMFSYPVGLPSSFDDVTREAVAATGASVAFAYDGGFAREGGAWDRLALPRTTGGMSTDILAATLTWPQRFARW